MRCITKVITGECPETGHTQVITVKFEEINMAGRLQPGYKAIGFSCVYANEHRCNSKGSDGWDCPLFSHAAQQAF